MDAYVFQFIGEVVDAALSPFVEGAAGQVITDFFPMFLAIASLHLTLLGYAIGWGYVELPFSALMKVCAKYLIIGALAFNAGNYSIWVVGSVQGLESGFTQAFAGTESDQAQTVYQSVDQALGKGWGLGADLWEKAGTRGVTSFGKALGEYFNGLIIIIATALLGIPAGGMIVIAKAGLTLMLGVGPFFIALLLWPATSKFFDSWFGQCMTYALRVGLIAAVLGLAFKGFEAIINAVDLGSDQNTLFTSLVLLTFTSVMFWMLKEMNDVAGGLAGGLNSAAATLRGMAAGVVSPLKAINATSTRRDLQSGMMTTAGRLNHLVAGNSIVNPAYRQHVMQNLGKNWGRARGGAVRR